MSATLRFALLSGAVLVVLAVVLQSVLSGMITERGRQAAERSAEFVSRLAVEPVVRGVGAVDALDTVSRVRLDAVVASGVAGDVLARINVFDTDGLLVYGANRADVGVRVSTAPQLRRALEGRTSSKLAGHPDLRRAGALLEVYVPLRLNADSQVDGVVELYVPYAPVHHAVLADTRRLQMLLFGGLALLWLVLFRTFSQVSGRLRAEVASNEHQASHDALTGLPNRVLLAERLEQALDAGREAQTATSVLLLDLDGFKDVNDTLGHHHGDALLVEVSHRLAKALRRGDTLARLGGDEFAVVLPEVSGEDEAVAVGRRLREALSVPVQVEGLAVSVGVSVGIVVAPEQGDTAALLLQRADVAMYTAKQSHAGVAVYAADKDTYSADRLALLGELRGAIEGGQLVLHYQPRGAVQSGALLGVEALVRWVHPERGLIPPDVFIPLAEHSGLIQLLTPWVLDEALRAAAGWRADGLALEVSVNVSTRNLLDVGFPDMVRDALRTHRAEASSLVLEITETALMADPETARAVLLELKEIGVSLSVDDYGAGHSSLAYLQQLPVDELKIDRTFVTNMATDERDRAIVRSTVELGRNLGLRVVAEGVEDAASWAALAGLHCDDLQGYFLCRPLPEADLLRWVGAYVPAAPVVPSPRDAVSVRAAAG